jgi:hypothetical protein
VQMNVENLLHGCFAIGQKQVHAFALQTAFPWGTGEVRLSRALS